MQILAEIFQICIFTVAYLPIYIAIKEVLSYGTQIHWLNNEDYSEHVKVLKTEDIKDVKHKDP